MIQSLLESLNAALSASAGMALLASFVWGVLSILLSPCHLASIPLIVGFIHGQGRISFLRAFCLAGLFAMGILVTVVVLGVVTAAAGRLAGDVGPWACYSVALLFFLVGLHLMDVIPLPLPGPAKVTMQRRGLLAALALGLVFGIALGPCTFAYMAPVLGVTFTLGSSRPVLAAAVLLLYGLGHCAVIVAAGSAGGCVQRYLDWNQRKGAIVWIRRACGALVIGGGWWMVYSTP